MDLIQIGQPPAENESKGDVQIDPVCGMSVDPATAAATYRHGGRDYYFCCQHCLQKFKADPAAFIGDKPRQQPKAMPGVDYTCPMHPEVVQKGPGACPKCGMALEPMQPTAEEAPDPELIDMQRRFWVGAALALPVFIIAMAGLIPVAGLAHWLHQHMAL